MKHLKLFQTEAEYTAYKNGGDFITPNVSYAVDSTKTFYNPVTGSTSNYIMVDLGLPSGLKWADRNVGATNPEDAGLYFAWGETVGYTAEQVGTDKVFDMANYFDTTDGGSTFTKYNNDGGLTTLEAVDDAATVHMGSDWRMPTEAEFTELMNGTVPTFIDLQGNEYSKSEADSGAIAEYNLKGVKFTGTNGNSIFIPTAGDCYEAVLSGVGCYSSLWSSSLCSSDSLSAGYLYFNCFGGLNIDYYDRCCGLSVRVVQP